MNLTDVRRLLLRLFIAFLCLSAALAIFAILGGGFGELQVKIILSCLAVAAANICSMSCAAFLESRGRHPAGFAGIALASVSGAMVVAAIWQEISSETYWQKTGTLIVLSVGTAHSLGLLIPHLRREHRWTQTAGIACSAIIAVMIISIFWGNKGEEDFFRIMAVVAILGVFFSLVVPILARLKTDAGDGPLPGTSPLVLTIISDGLYEDPSGRRYHVQPVGAAEP